jgi:hypothetical protein
MLSSYAAPVITARGSVVGRTLGANSGATAEGGHGTKVLQPTDTSSNPSSLQSVGDTD